MSWFSKVKKVWVGRYIEPVFHVDDRINTTKDCPGYYASNGLIVALRWDTKEGVFQYAIMNKNNWVNEQYLVLR